MKKIICALLAVLLIMAMTVPAFAVTPDLGVPDVPEIPDISDDVEIELPEGVFDGYLPDLDIDIEIELPTDPIEPPADPTEPPSEKPTCPGWCDWVKGWLEWWLRMLRPCHHGHGLR